VNAATIPPQKVSPADSNSRNPTPLKSGEIGGKTGGGATDFDAILAKVVEGRNTGEPAIDPTVPDQGVFTKDPAVQLRAKQNTTSVGKTEKRDGGAQTINVDPGLSPAIGQQLSISAALSSLAALPALMDLAAGATSPSGEQVPAEQQQPCASHSAKPPHAGTGASRALTNSLTNELLPGNPKPSALPQMASRELQSQVTASAQPAATPAIKIVASHVETHFAPTANFSPPTQQVVNAVLNELSRDAPKTDAPALGVTAPVQLSTSQANSPVRVLTVQLEPADLGSVAIKMRLTGNHLDLEVVAAQRDTLRALSSDHDRLRGTLESCGYSIDNLSIKASPSAQSASSDSQNGSQRNPQNQPGEDLPSGFAQSGSERGNSREKTAKESARSATPLEDRHEVSSTDRSRLGRYI
jgi:flagellar hook-length control protein FliK